VKIRIYSPFFPYPPTDGALQVIYEQARALSQLGHEVEIVSWKGEAAANCPLDVKIVRLFADRARSRISRVVRMFLRGVPSPELYYYPSEMAKEWRELPQADLGIYHYSFSYSWLGPELSNGGAPESRVVVHFHNLEHELFQSRAADQRNPFVALIHKRNAELLRIRELKLAGTVNELWFLSPVDMSRYAAKSPALQRLVPPCFTAEVWSPSARGTDIGFVGALDFGPNIRSLEWIFKEVCPKLKSLGFSGRLKIAGKGDAPLLRAKAREYDFVDWMGFVPDLNKFWSSLAYSLVPHITGSGVRMKLLESLARGVPVLSNRAAAERIQPELLASRLLHISDDSNEWARIICRGSESVARAVGGDAGTQAGTLVRPVL
jgi:polysaccharide biosynthesis protein PslH